MSWQTPPVFASGVDDADWAIVVGDLRFLYSPPTCEVSHSSAQNVSNATETALTLATETTDTDGMHSAGQPTRITFQTAGRYLVAGQVVFPLNTNGARRGSIRLGGSDFIARQTIGAPMQTTTTGLDPHTVYRFTASEYVELMAFHNSTLALTMPSGSQRLAASWLGA